MTPWKLVLSGLDFDGKGEGCDGGYHRTIDLMVP